MPLPARLPPQLANSERATAKSRTPESFRSPVAAAADRVDVETEESQVMGRERIAGGAAIVRVDAVGGRAAHLEIVDHEVPAAGQVKPLSFSSSSTGRGAPGSPPIQIGALSVPARSERKTPPA